MNWDKDLLSKIDFENISNKEEKQSIANLIANKVKDGDIVGFGSGSTSYLAIYAIAEKIKNENIKITAIPTSHEVELLCNSLDIPITSLLEKKPDWSFDGTDEVNDKLWLIKGRGGALFREKLNIANSKITYILADNTKFVEKLGSNYTIPVECYFSSINYVKECLKKLGAKKIYIRKAISKDGPVITENGNIILETKFENIDENLEKNIKMITGVIECGLFIGYNIEIVK